MPQQFAFPFRIANGQLVTTEQGSLDDIAGRVYTLALTEPPYFTRQPDLGLTNQAHRQGGADMAEVQRQMDTYVDDAHVLAEQDLSKLNDALAVIELSVRA